MLVFLRKLVVDGSKGAVKIESTITSIPPIIRATGGFRATNSKITETKSFYFFCFLSSDYQSFKT